MSLGARFAATFALACTIVACGSSSGTDDAGADGGADAAVDSALPVPLHCQGSQLLIAEVDPMVSITLFNPTDADIDLTGTGWVLCQRPNYVQLEMIESGVTIAAHSSHTYAMPGAFFDQGDDSGELVLYRMSAFTNPDVVVDYVCWGDGRSESRQSVAAEGSKWSGGCAPAITGETLRRRGDTTGLDALAYESTGASTPLVCP